MNTTLSPVTVQRYLALQGELIALVEQDYTGLTPKLEQIIRAFEFAQKSVLATQRHVHHGRWRRSPSRCSGTAYTRVSMT